ncbi:hypothetical protein [Methylobacterium sp. ID0610]|uniref:hypothetical protein n=1 Tax=Methylobacterium carpenticola TaxID=3344827 RepID=UPI0036743845
MLCTTQSGLEARAPAPDAEPWRADLEALRRLLQDSRPAEPSRAQIADLIEDEAPGALPRRARERIAERLAATLRRRLA